jgi:phospholipase/carboxylesterase
MMDGLNSVQVPFEAGFLLHTPATISDKTLLVLALHGYGSNPEAMLRLSLPAVGDHCILASLRGPNQAYVSGVPSTDEVAYNWGTRRHGDINIRLHHNVVTAVAAELGARFSIPAHRTILMGFSQPVGLNYRFIGTFPERAGGVIAICGGVPKDWEEEKYSRVDAPVLHISRSEDEFFPAEVASRFPDRLRHHTTNLEFHMLPGGHRFPSKAGPLIRDWMARCFA